MYLWNKVYIEEWKEKYKEDIDVQSRIENYLKHHKVAMEIQRFQNTSLIELMGLKKDFPKFLIPQMDYYLDDHPLLQYLEDNLVPIE